MWTVRKLDGGSKRLRSAVVAVGEKIYSFGGLDDDTTSWNYRSNLPMDVRVMQTDDYQWRVLTTNDYSSLQHNEIPFQLFGHTAVFYNDLVYIWGGINEFDGSADCNILYCFETTTHLWSRPSVQGLKPTARAFHSACIVNDSMYVFGGVEDYSRVKNYPRDVQKLDLKSMKWSVVPTKGELPIGREFHSATAINDCIYIFGGRGHTGSYFYDRNIYCDQVIVFDTQTSNWITPEVNGYRPASRWGHTSFCHKGYLFIYGGHHGEIQQYYDDLLRYDPESCCWSMVMNKTREKEPRPRGFQSCCVINNRVFVYGGISSNPNLNDERILEDENHGLDVELEHVGAGPMQRFNDFDVLDFGPSLETLAIMKVLEYKLNQDELPETIRSKIKAMIGLSLPK